MDKKRAGETAGGPEPLPTTNHYLRAPLAVHVLRAATGATARRVVLLGSAVPRPVAEAARRAAARRGTAEPALKAFYGAGWQRVLGLKAAAPSEPPVTISSIAAYPEDTLADLRLKIYATTGIPPYRQHVFYTTGDPADDDAVRNPYTADTTPLYRLRIDGVPVATDIAQLMNGNAIAIDHAMEERHADIEIEVDDLRLTLEVSPHVFIDRVFVVDLQEVLDAHRDFVTASLGDRLRFDLLYYTFYKFWPQLTPDAFRLACTLPETIGDAYPSLAPAAEAVEAQLAAAQAVTDRAYVYAARASRTRGGLSVTAAAVVVAPRDRIRVDVRNVFDWVPTRPEVPAATVRFEVYNENNLIVPVVATHRHETSARTPGAAWFLSKPPPRTAVRFCLAAAELGGSAAGGGVVGGGAAAPQLERRPTTLYLEIREDGSYSVETWWREDDRVTFDAVTAYIAKVSRPLITEVNAMGDAALPLRGRLAHADACGGDTCARAFGLVTASAFWAAAITTAGFRELKDQWRAFERARIITVKGLQQSGTFAFQFVKVPAEPVLAGYGHLTENSAAHPAGRTVRIHHRATDLRIEVVDARGLEEFELIRRYVFSLLDHARATLPGFLEAPGGAEPSLRETLHGPGSRRLRRLQERDPVLFDLKRHDENATVYSVLCQAGRQPVMYSEEEAAKLKSDKNTREKHGKLVKYWNFTEKKPAYYECPSAAYPFLSLRAGKHPLGYCLPCCKKAVSGAAAAASLSCAGAASGGPPPPGATLAAARHVLSYGKAVPPGRVSDLPAMVAGLFRATEAAGTLRAVGVRQSVPAVAAAGFLFSLAEALGGESGAAGSSSTVGGFVAALCRDLGDAWWALGGGGAGAAFGSAADLADALTSAFVRQAPGFSPLSEGGRAEGWEAIVGALACRVFDVDIIRLHDVSGVGDVAVDFSLVAGRPEVAVFVTSPAGTYPVFAMDAREYLRAPPGARAGKARRRFPAAGPVAAGFLALRAPPPAAARRRPDPELVRAVFGERRVRHFLFNSQDRCYGAIVEAGAAELAFLPLVEQSGAAAARKVLYGPRPRNLAYPRAALEAAVDEVNEFVARRRAAKDSVYGQYAKIVPQYSLIDAKNQDIGFTAGGLYYWADPADALATSHLPQIAIPYDPLAVDEALWAEATRPAAVKAPPPPGPPTAPAKMVNRLYHLFLAEFAAVVREDRNRGLRARILEAVRAARAARHTPREAAALDRLVTKGEDRLALKALMSNDHFEAAFNRAAFSFDATTLERLRKLDRPAVTAALRTIMAGRCELVDGGGPAAAEAPNIYAACAVESSVDRPHCAANKLIVPRDKFDSLVDILASDVLNPYKVDTLATASAGVFDETAFITRPGEFLTVSVV